MSRSRVAGFLVLCCLVLPVMVTGQGTGANPIAGITVTEEANETVVTITASRTPTFSVFKLDDPVRLFVDVNQGEVSKVAEPVLVDNGVLDQVGTLQFRSSGVPVGRIIIGMRQDAAYDVRTVGNGIVVRIDAAGRRASTAEAGALATQVTNVREELKREQELLRQLKDARERDQSLRGKEEASRLEAERLRAEAQQMQEQAQRDAAQADKTAREASQRAAAAERQLQALKDETTRTQARQLQAEKDLKALSERKASETTTESKRLEAQRADASAKIAEAERKLQSLREETAKAEAQRSSVVQAGQVETDRLNALRKEQDALRQQTATAEAQRKALVDETAKAEGRRKALEDETARALARREQAEQELKSLTERRTTQMSAEAKADVARLEAQRGQADRQAREASAKVSDAEQKLAALRDETAKAEGRRKALEDETAKAEGRRKLVEDETAKTESQRATLADARRLEAERLQVLRKEQDALKAGAAALAERNAADVEAARQAATRRVAEEQAADRARLAREAAEAALVAEQDCLEAVRTARVAEEANQKARKEVAARENENLALARAARQNEEKLQAELKTARDSKESAAQAKVAELERILAEQREKTTAGAKARDEALRTAQQSAKATETELSTAKARSISLEKRLAELQGEQGTLAKRAKAAEDEARKAATRSDQAAALLARKEVARRDADETGAQLKAKREELTRLEAQAKSQSAELQVVSSRKQKETADLSAIEVQRAQATAAYDETARKLANEERRLVDIQTERAQAEKAATEARQQVMELQARRQAELGTLRQELATARTQAQGVETTKTEALAREVAAREGELAARRAELAGLRADVEAARAESASKDVTIREMTTEMNRARSEVARAQETTSTKEKEVAGLRAALNAEKAGRADRSEVQRLQTALADKERSLASVRTDLADRLARADELARRRADEVERLGHPELQRLKTERRDGESTEVARMKERLQNREAEMQVLRKAYDDARVAARKDAKVESRASSLKAKVEEQQNELKALRAEYQKEAVGSKAGLRERDARIAELAQQIDALKASGAAKESQEVVRLKDLVARREAELASARAKETESRQTTAATQVQKQEQKRLRSDLEEAQALLDYARTDMSGAKAKEREALDREAKAASRIDELAAAQARADHDLQGVRAEASELARQLTTREAEVARLQNELDQSRKTPPARAAAPEAQARKAVIRSIDFKSTRTGPTLVLGVEGTPQYDVTPGTNQWIMTIRNATLPKDLERRMDVTAFESRVSMVSAYTAADGSVRIVAELAKPVGQQVQSTDGRLAWTFAGQGSDQMMAGSATAPAESRATPPARMVARAVPSAPPPGYTPAFAPAASAPAPLSSPSPGTVAAGTGDGAREYLKPAMVPKKKKYRGKRINLTVKDADIHNVLTFLAREGKVNVVISEAVQGKVTFHLEDVPWDLALDTVLKTKGLDYVIEQGIYRVAPIDVIQKEYEAQVEKQKKVQELKPIIIRLLPVNYGEGVEMQNRVRSVLSPKGVADLDTRTNTLIIKDTEEYLEAAEDLVRRLDLQTAQILIEARIVEARTTFTEDIGIQWGGKFAMASAYGNETGLVFPSSIGLQGGAEPPAPTGGLTVANPHWAVNLPAAVGQGAGGALGLQLGSIGGAANLTLRLSAAESTGDVKIISSPRISTLDNRRATISQGVSIPISVVSASGVNTQFFSADLRLDVTPHVTRDGHINMKLDISKNEPDFGNVAANGNPTIQKKEARTELLIRDGDTTVIGGIYTRTTSKSYKKIPLLGDIPILGWLFKSRSQQDNRSELLIFITPKVVNREVAL